MRTHYLAAVLLCLAGTVGAAQDPPADKPPKKGDRVLVRGCLSGPLLESTETAAVDTERKVTAPLRFRLSGDKKLLKQMRQDDDGRVVLVTGVLKSDLSHGGPAGKKIGNTRIVVGVGPGAHAPRQPSPPHIPVVEVKSYEPLTIPCGG